MIHWELSLTASTGLGLSEVEEQQTWCCQLLADIYGCVTIRHFWKIETEMGCWHNIIYYTLYHITMDSSPWSWYCKTFWVTRIFTWLGARMAEHRIATHVFSHFWWRQEYDTVLKTAVLYTTSKDAISWENLAGLVWRVYSLHASQEHLLSTPMDVQSIIGCPKHTHPFHLTGMVRLNGIAKKASHQYAFKTLGKINEGTVSLKYTMTSKWSVQQGIIEHKNELTCCVLLSNLPLFKWNKCIFPRSWYSIILQPTPFQVQCGLPCRILFKTTRISITNLILPCLGLPENDAQIWRCIYIYNFLDLLGWSMILGNISESLEQEEFKSCLKKGTWMSKISCNNLHFFISLDVR